MLEREKVAPTYMGEGLAIPHGTSSAKSQVLRSGIAVLQYPGGIDWDGETARLVVAIAGKGDEHLEILARVAETLEDPEVLGRLSNDASADEIYSTLK